MRQYTEQPDGSHIFETDSHREWTEAILEARAAGASVTVLTGGPGFSVRLRGLPSAAEEAPAEEAPAEEAPAEEPVAEPKTSKRKAAKAEEIL